MSCFFIGILNNIKISGNRIVFVVWVLSISYMSKGNNVKVVVCKKSWILLIILII